MFQDLRTTGSEPEMGIPKPPWPLRTRTAAALCAIASGAAIFCTAFFIERYFHEQGTDPLRMIAASDALAALLGALLMVRVFFNLIERRLAIVQRLKTIGEINHHIRNALDLIQLSAQTTADKRAITVIQEGVDRIEWTLREVLGPAGPLGRPLMSGRKTSVESSLPLRSQREK